MPQARLQKPVGFILAKACKFRFATSQVHGDKSHITATLAELRLVLVAVESQFKALTFKPEKCFAESMYRLGRCLLRVGNDQHAKGRTNQVLQFLENRSHFCVVPDAEIVKTEKKLASHAVENSKRL